MIKVWHNKLGFMSIANGDWQLSPFIKDPKQGINPLCKNAIKWRQIIGFDI